MVMSTASFAGIRFDRRKLHALLRATTVLLRVRLWRPDLGPVLEAQHRLQRCASTLPSTRPNGILIEMRSWS